MSSDSKSSKSKRSKSSSSRKGKSDSKHSKSKSSSGSKKGSSRRSSSKSDLKAEIEHKVDTNQQKNDTSENVTSIASFTSQSSFEQCENCHTKTASIYCTDCNLILCKDCSGQIHSIQSFMNHKTVPLSNVESFRTRCPIHPSNFALQWCCSCNTLVCQECQHQHLHESHLIIDLIEAFDRKRAQFHTLLSTQLPQLREQGLRRINEIKLFMEGIDREQNVIEVESRKIYDEIINELEHIGRQKKLHLESELQFIRTRLSRLQEFENMSMSRLHDQKSFEFLRNFDDISRQAKAVLSTPIEDTPLSPPPILYPRTLVEWRHQSKDLETLKNKIFDLQNDLNVRDLKIEELQQNKNDALDQKNKEILDWIKLNDTYAKRIDRLNMGCHFCGCKLSPISVNSFCPVRQELGQKPTSSLHHHFIHVSKLLDRFPELATQKQSFSKYDISQV
eukprot:TRINITY_DN1746_c0_g1_i1.p1 TRINITY_DN1746_c0_g1~~TRINITY_DN1746_c0_g1_i1.p1  ORF type:complete len:448 (+),score=97.84 TRINITY_DN1746_c0_g1_i1:42-1385(+)